MRFAALLLLVVSFLFGCPAAPGARCPEGQLECSGTCRDVRVDASNCGACGTACGAGQVCAAGACAVTCPGGQLACGGRCVSPSSDPGNCGASGDCQGAHAGTACPTGEVCGNGACAVTCPAGQLLCGGRCVSPSSDPGYCGASGDCQGANAGTACPTGGVCGNGACTVSCPAGQLLCGGRCVDPLNDRAACGASGDCQAANAGTVCPAGEVCGNGACAVSCPAGQLACSGRCVDPLTDRAACGASGDCQGANAGAVCADGSVCSGGACALSCSAGQVNCGGTCVDPQSNPRFCGAAGDCQGMSSGGTCAVGMVCDMGTCLLACPAGELNCAGRCIDPWTDRNFCGASGTCTTAAERGSVCSGSQLCAYRQCTSTFAASCATIHALDPTAPDGAYTLFLHGDPMRPFAAFCRDLGGTPLTYLPLVNTGGASNVSGYSAAGQPGSTDVVTRWTKLRFDPVNVAVDPSDYQYSSSTGSVAHENTTQVPYGVARECAGTPPGGVAQVDLRGLPFAVVPNWSLGGYVPDGVAVPSAFNKVVAVTGGGSCGWNAPGGDRYGGVPLPLRWCQAPTPEVCNGLDDDCDGVVDNGCPTGLSIGGAGVGFGPYGSTSGTVFDDLCQPGEVLGGLGGNIAGLAFGPFIGVQGLCRHLTVVEDPSVVPYLYKVTTAAGTDMPLHGSFAMRIECPTNEVLVGLKGSTGGGIVTGLTLECAPLTISGAPGAFVVGRGAVDERTVANFNVAGTTPFTAISAAPQVLNDLFGRFGPSLYSLGFFTSTTSVVVR